MLLTNKSIHLLLIDRLLYKHDDVRFTTTNFSCNVKFIICGSNKLVKSNLFRC